MACGMQRILLGFVLGRVTPQTPCVNLMNASFSHQCRRPQAEQTTIGERSKTATDQPLTGVVSAHAIGQLCRCRPMKIQLTTTCGFGLGWMIHRGNEPVWPILCGLMVNVLLDVISVFLAGVLGLQWMTRTKHPCELCVQWLQNRRLDPSVKCLRRGEFGVTDGIFVYNNHGVESHSSKPSEAWSSPPSPATTPFPWSRPPPRLRPREGPHHRRHRSARGPCHGRAGRSRHLRPRVGQSVRRLLLGRRLLRRGRSVRHRGGPLQDELQHRAVPAAVCSVGGSGASRAGSGRHRGRLGPSAAEGPAAERRQRPGRAQPCHRRCPHRVRLRGPRCCRRL